MAWAACGLDNCHCEGEARSNPGDCLAPVTEMDVNVETPPEGVQHGPPEAEDFGAAFFAPLLELIEPLKNYPGLWAIPLAGVAIGLFFYAAYALPDRAYSKGRLKKTEYYILKMVAIAMTSGSILSVTERLADIGSVGIVSSGYKAVLLWLGLAAGAYLSYTVGEVLTTIAAKFRKARPEAVDIELRLEGCGSGVNSVILGKEMKGVNWVDIPDSEGGQLRVLALGFSKSEMKEWAGRLLSAFAKKGHKVKRVIIYKLEDAVSLETHTAISDFKPHVVIIPHSLDTRPLVQFLQSVARRALEARGRDERRGSVLVEYETRSPWDMYISEAVRRRLEGKEPHPSSDPLEAFRAAESELANHFNTYLYYHSIPKMLKVLMVGRAGKFNVALGERLAARFRSILIAYKNALTGAERVQTFGQAKKSDPVKLGGFFAQRFRATRIGGAQADERPTEGRRVGGRLASILFNRFIDYDLMAFRLRSKAAAFYSRLHNLHPDPSIIDRMWALRNSAESKKRRLCAKVLKEVAQGDEDLLFILEVMIRDPDADVRKEVLEAFVYLYLRLETGDPLKEKIRADIERFLTDSDNLVRKGARNYIVGMNPSNLTGGFAIFGRDFGDSIFSQPSSWELLAIGAALGVFAALLPYLMLRFNRDRRNNPPHLLDGLRVEEPKGQARRDMLRKAFGERIDTRPYKALRVSYALNPQINVAVTMLYFPLLDGKLQIGEFVFEASNNKADDRFIEAIKRRVAAHLIQGLMRLNPKTTIQGSASDPARREIFEDAGMRPSASDPILYVGDARDLSFTLKGEVVLQQGI